jgi:hypothetical protein
MRVKCQCDKGCNNLLDIEDKGTGRVSLVAEHARTAQVVGIDLDLAGAKDVVYMLRRIFGEEVFAQ